MDRSNEAMIAVSRKLTDHPRFPKVGGHRDVAFLDWNTHPNQPPHLNLNDWANAGVLIGMLTPLALPFEVQSPQPKDEAFDPDQPYWSVAAFGCEVYKAPTLAWAVALALLDTWGE